VRFRFCLLLAFAGALPADAVPRLDRETIRSGLSARGREIRERALEEARTWARRDPESLARLFGGLDTRGRCLLVRALGSAFAPRAARVGLRVAAGACDEVFHALLAGLVAGGRESLFARAPRELTGTRRAELDALRLRWRLEEEIARLKSPSGLTGHYEGQYGRIRKLGRGVMPILFDIVLDRAHPLPGESAAGPYQSIHPWMVRFDSEELRSLAAHAFGEVVSPDDEEWIARLEDLYYELRSRRDDDLEFERSELAPAIAFGLHDLGRPRPAARYLAYLEDRAHSRVLSFDVLEAWWALGYAYIRLGRPELGEKWYERLVDFDEGGNRGVAAYNLACNFAMRAMHEPRFGKDFKRRAVHWLRRAILEFHYADWQWMEEDKDLSYVRGEPGYQELLAYLKKKYPGRPKGTIPKELEDFLKGSWGQAQDREKKD